MRFITLILFALLPLTAMASDGVSLRDIEDIYEYVDTSVAGNSCKAESFDGSQACSITCVAWENAICSSSSSRAHCACVPTSKPPKDVEALR